MSKIQKKLNKTKSKLTLKAGEYYIDTPLFIDKSCINFTGECWNYPSDPNGVFESFVGTKLKIKKDSFGLQVGKGDSIGGVMVSNFGFQGTIIGMDTRTLFNKDSLSQNAGLVFCDGRVDQGEFSKLSFTGLSIGMLAIDNSEIDACVIDKCNFDGCYVGVYFKPRASYYPKITNCVFADNPSYGIIVDGTNAQMHHLEICNNKFVRNCGANIHSTENASIFFNNVNECLIYNNVIDDAGSFWYYNDDATSNGERQISSTDCVGILVKGDKNNVFSNVITNSKKVSILVKGNNNNLVGNIVDGDVIIDGENNVVNSLVFTTKNAKLILRGIAQTTTEILGVSPDRVVKE